MAVKLTQNDWLSLGVSAAIDEIGMMIHKRNTRTKNLHWKRNHQQNIYG